MISRLFQFTGVMISLASSVHSCPALLNYKIESLIYEYGWRMSGVGPGNSFYNSVDQYRSRVAGRYQKELWEAFVGCSIARLEAVTGDGFIPNSDHRHVTNIQRRVTYSFSPRDVASVSFCSYQETGYDGESHFGPDSSCIAFRCSDGDDCIEWEQTITLEDTSTRSANGLTNMVQVGTTVPRGDRERIEQTALDWLSSVQ